MSIIAGSVKRALFKGKFKFNFKKGFSRLHNTCAIYPHFEITRPGLSMCSFQYVRLSLLKELDPHPISTYSCIHRCTHPTKNTKINDQVNPYNKHAKRMDIGADMCHLDLAGSWMATTWT